jgi:hypothetical protein
LPFTKAIRSSQVRAALWSILPSLPLGAAQGTSGRVRRGCGVGLAVQRRRWRGRPPARRGVSGIAARTTAPCSPVRSCRGLGRNGEGERGGKSEEWRDLRLGRWVERSTLNAQRATFKLLWEGEAVEAGDGGGVGVGEVEGAGGVEVGIGDGGPGGEARLSQAWMRTGMLALR